MDLIATARHHATAGVGPALWFSAFCALLPEQLPQLTVAAAVAVGAPVPTLPSCAQVPGTATLAAAGGGVASRSSAAAAAGEAARSLTAATPIAAAAAEAVAAAEGGKALSLQASASAAASAAGPLSGEVLVQLLQLQCWDQDAAVRFYLFCCCQLAYPSTITALFPEADDAAPLVKGHLLLDSLKAIAR